MKLYAVTVTFIAVVLGGNWWELTKERQMLLVEKESWKNSAVEAQIQNDLWEQSYEALIHRLETCRAGTEPLRFDIAL